MKNDQPQRIYKYRSLSGEYGREAIENAIIHHRLYWQSPLEFNDPFDCDPIFYFGDSERQRQAFIRNGPRSTLTGPRVERMRQIADLKRRPHEAMAQVLRNEWPNWMAETAVTCFSGKNDDLLMWAHYADSHRGVCLIFDESIEDDFFTLSVSYESVRPRANICTMGPADIMKVTLLTKSTHWEYEDEYRIIAYRKLRGYKNFPSKCLVGLVLGAKISADDEGFVLGLLTKRASLEVYRAQIDSSQFKINIVAA